MSETTRTSGVDTPDEALDATPDEAVDGPADGVVEERNDDENAPERHVEWWHREHPTFTALSGFFTGLALVCVVPGLFIALLQVFFEWETAEEAFPFVLLFLLVPFGLILWPDTRRFGKYLLFGMVATALVVVGVGSFVWWLLADRGL